MVFTSERKRKTRNRVIGIVVAVGVVLLFATMITYLTYSGTVAKYGLNKDLEIDTAVLEMNKTIASQAFIYGYPAVEMYDFFYQIAVDKESRFYTPLNKFLHVTRFAQPQYETILNSDADTLSSVAWVDVKREPAVIYCPDTGDNYYSIEVLDFYNNCAGSFFKTKTEVSKRNFIITYSGWEGKIPADTQQITVNTPYAFVYVRLKVPGVTEVERLKKVQQKFNIRPLSWHNNTNEYFGTTIDFPKLTHETPMEFYNALNAIMQLNPPPQSDMGLISFFNQIGVSPGNVIMEENFSEIELRGINEGFSLGQNLLAYSDYKIMVPLKGGFSIVSAANAYTGDFYARASLMNLGTFGYNPQYFLNLYAHKEMNNEFLHGKNRYVLTFEKPPECEEGWSVTLYNASNDTMVKNDMKVYSICSWNNPWKYNEDGSLSIYISQQSPEDKSMINNWLPAPDDNFYLTLRIYLPGEDVLSGKWVYPTITKV